MKIFTIFLKNYIGAGAAYKNIDSFPSTQGWSSWDKEQKKDFEIGEENSAFAQLLQFLYMMKSLGK